MAKVLTISTKSAWREFSIEFCCCVCGWGGSWLCLCWWIVCNVQGKFLFWNLIWKRQCQIAFALLSLQSKATFKWILLSNIWHEMISAPAICHDTFQTATTKHTPKEQMCSTASNSNLITVRVCVCVWVILIKYIIKLLIEYRWGCIILLGYEQLVFQRISKCCGVRSVLIAIVKPVLYAIYLTGGCVTCVFCSKSIAIMVYRLRWSEQWHNHIDQSAQQIQNAKLIQSVHRFTSFLSLCTHFFLACAFIFFFCFFLVLLLLISFHVIWAIGAVLSNPCHDHQFVAVAVAVIFFIINFILLLHSSKKTIPINLIYQIGWAMLKNGWLTNGQPNWIFPFQLKIYVFRPIFILPLCSQ